MREYPVTAGAMLQRKVASVKAVSGVTLHVDAGETLGLVGESGLRQDDARQADRRHREARRRARSRSAGERCSRCAGGALRRARRDLQMMFQDPYASLDPRMRVQAILREPLVIQGIGTAQASRTQRIATMLDEVGLPHNALERYPHEFSGGQRQRIALARALMLEPKVIVADEPVSALDVSIRSQVLNLMKRLQAEHSMASVVISHDLAVVKYLADRIGVMYLGKLVELGTGEDIYLRPAHPYTDALIKTIPVPDPARRAREDRGRRSAASCRARSTRPPAVASGRAARAPRICARSRAAAAPVRPGPRSCVPLPSTRARRRGDRERRSRGAANRASDGRGVGLRGGARGRPTSVAFQRRLR